MELGTRVSGGVGRARPRVAPSQGKGFRGSAGPRAAATPRCREGEVPSRRSAHCAPAPVSPPALRDSNRKRNSARPPPLGAARRGERGRTRPEPARGSVPQRERGGEAVLRGRSGADRLARGGQPPDRTNPGRGAAAEDRAPGRPRLPGVWRRAANRPPAPAPPQTPAPDANCTPPPPAPPPQPHRCQPVARPGRGQVGPAAPPRCRGPVANNRQRQGLRGRGRRNTDFNDDYFPLV